MKVKHLVCSRCALNLLVAGGKHVASESVLYSIYGTLLRKRDTVGCMLALVDRNSPQCMVTLMSHTNQAAIASLIYSFDHRHQEPLCHRTCYSHFSMMPYMLEYGELCTRVFSALSHSPTSLSLALQMGQFAACLVRPLCNFRKAEREK